MQNEIKYNGNENKKINKRDDGVRKGHEEIGQQNRQTEENTNKNRRREKNELVNTLHLVIRKKSVFGVKKHKTKRLITIVRYENVETGVVRSKTRITRLRNQLRYVVVKVSCTLKNELGGKKMVNFNCCTRTFQ